MKDIPITLRAALAAARQGKTFAVQFMRKEGVDPRTFAAEVEKLTGNSFAPVGDGVIIFFKKGGRLNFSIAFAGLDRISEIDMVFVFDRIEKDGDQLVLVRIFEGIGNIQFTFDLKANAVNSHPPEFLAQMVKNYLLM